MAAQPQLLRKLRNNGITQGWGGGWGSDVLARIEKVLSVLVCIDWYVLVCMVDSIGM